MTEEERQLARARVAAWPTEDRRALIRLEPREVEAIALLVALLDLRPENKEGRPEDRPST